MEGTFSPGCAIPEHIIQPFLRSTLSSTLDEALELLVKSARADTGRSELALQKILPVVLELTKFLSNSSYRQLLFSSLKLLRNLCAGEILNQNAFIREKGFEVVSVAMTSVGFGSNSDFGIVRTGLQILGNVALAGEEHQRAIWSWFFPNGFMEILRMRRLEICDPLCMVVYSCCNGSNERLAELCGVEGLTLVAEIIRTASTVGSEEEWLKWIVSRICFKESHFPLLFSQLSSDGAGITGDNAKCEAPLFTAEQVFLLFVLSETLNQQVDEINPSCDFALSVLEILRKALQVLDSCSRGKSGLPTGDPEVDVLGYSITILRDVCAQVNPGSFKVGSSTNVVDSLLSSGLLELQLDTLHMLEPAGIIMKSISLDKNQAGFGDPNILKVCPYKGFRRDIVAVIGNCLFQRKHVQDAVRNKNGILLLMQQCVTDEDNPFLREWGIWSVRNLLLGNEENQREVAELELQGSADVPQIAELGLRVKVDQKTRRPKLVNA